MKYLRLSFFLSWLLCGPAFAAFGYGTPAEPGSGSSSAGTLPVPSVPAGATLFGFIGWGSGPTLTITDSTGNTINLCGSQINAGSATSGQFWYVVNATAGTHTINASFSSGTGYYIGALYITGVPASPVDACKSIESNFIGTGVNILTTGNVTTTTNGDVLVSMMVGTGGGAPTPTVGTSPNAFTTLSFVTSTIMGEYFVQSSAGAIAATGGTSTPADFILGVIALKPSGGGSSCTNYGWNTATGNWQVPTASTGSYSLQSGGNGTVDCASIDYRQKPGAFGVN